MVPINQLFRCKSLGLQPVFKILSRINGNGMGEGLHWKINRNGITQHTLQYSLSAKMLKAGKSLTLRVDTIYDFLFYFKCICLDLTGIGCSVHTSTNQKRKFFISLLFQQICNSYNFEIMFTVIFSYSCFFLLCTPLCGIIYYTF